MEVGDPDVLETRATNPALALPCRLEPTSPEGLGLLLLTATTSYLSLLEYPLGYLSLWVCTTPSSSLLLSITYLSLSITM